LALKDDLEGVKQTLNAEEQFLENVIKGEFFIKKHKKTIISVIVVAVLVLASYYTTKAIKEKTTKNANEAYAALILNPADADAQAKLKKENPALFALYEFRQAMDKKDSAKLQELANSQGIDPILKEIINFEATGSESQLMSAYGTFLKGHKLLKEGKIDQANNEFAKIPADSQFNSIINNLKHYQPKGAKE